MSSTTRSRAANRVTGHALYRISPAQLDSVEAPEITFRAVRASRVARRAHALSARQEAVALRARSYEERTAGRIEFARVLVAEAAHAERVAADLEAETGR